MRIATYNHMFGCNGRGLIEFIRVHALHATQQYGLLEKRVKLHRTLNTIKKAHADILGVNEVLGEDQRKKIIELLKLEGYRYFHTGKGHGMGKKHMGRYETVETLIATKEPSEIAWLPNFNVPHASGYGGGVVGIHLPKENLYLIQLHLALAQGNEDLRAAFFEQLKAVEDKMQEIEKEKPQSKIVVMGDFNLSYKKLSEYSPILSRLEKISGEGVTCSTTRVIGYFYRKDLDYILGKGLSSKSAGMIKGLSDHKLVWVEV